MQKKFLNGKITLHGKFIIETNFRVKTYLSFSLTFLLFRFS